jgi:hypothetical protein
MFRHCLGLDDRHAAAPARCAGQAELPLARLLANLKSALNGSSRICVISGETGIGKTRLLTAILDRARVHDLSQLPLLLAASGPSQNCGPGPDHAASPGMRQDRQHDRTHRCL